MRAQTPTDLQSSASPARRATPLPPSPHPGSPAPSAVYQDDKEQKLNGVKSLIKYATMCQYMLVPTAEQGLLPPFLQYIPGYGSRGWW